MRSKEHFLPLIRVVSRITCFVAVFSGLLVQVTSAQLMTFQVAPGSSYEYLISPWFNDGKECGPDGECQFDVTGTLQTVLNPDGQLRFISNTFELDGESTEFDEWALPIFDRLFDDAALQRSMSNADQYLGNGYSAALLNGNRLLQIAGVADARPRDGDGYRIAMLATLEGTPTGDFDGNGIYDCADIDALVSEIQMGSSDASFDFNGDGTVGLDDRDTWLAIASSTHRNARFDLGDLDLSGRVNSTDLGLLLNNFGATDGIAYCGGDLNADSNVDSTDLGLLLNTLGIHSQWPESVPEPNGLGLVAIGLATMILRRCTRRR